MASLMHVEVTSELLAIRLQHDELIESFRKGTEEIVEANRSWKRFLPGYLRRKEEELSAMRRKARKVDRRLRKLEKKGSTLLRNDIDDAEEALRSCAESLAALEGVYSYVKVFKTSGIVVKSTQLRDAIAHCLDRGIFPRERLWGELWGGAVAATPAEDKFLQKLIVSKPDVMMPLLKKKIVRQRRVVNECRKALRKLVVQSHTGVIRQPRGV